MHKGLIFTNSNSNFIKYNKNIAVIITILFCFAESALSAQNIQLEEIRIARDLNVNKLIINIADNFKKKRVGFYASKILPYRSVFSYNKCIEFNALQGLFFVPEYNWNTNVFFWNNSSNYNRVAPLTVFRSSPLNNCHVIYASDIINHCLRKYTLTELNAN